MLPRNWFGSSNTALGLGFRPNDLNCHEEG